MIDYKLMHEKMIRFIKENTQGFNGVVLGLSGGLDSAVVLKLLCDANVKVNALLLPTKGSNLKNIEDAKNLCNMLDVYYEIIYIDDILQSFKKITQATGLREYNLCSRIRMSILYDYSAKNGFLVAGTTNKSERMLGYGTIYGDLACAFNPIGDVYKSDLFDFARFLNIPSEIIEKKPSADFYEGQSDEGDLGYTYFEIDECLKGNVKDKVLKDFIEKRVASNLFKQKMPKILDFNDIY